MQDIRRVWIAVQYEFTQRCREDAIIKIKDDYDDDECKPLKIMDKEMRSIGMTSKAAAVFSFHETGDHLEAILKDRIFMEPRLVIFRDTSNEKCTQVYIVAEQEVIFEVDHC